MIHDLKVKCKKTFFDRNNADVVFEEGMWYDAGIIKDGVYQGHYDICRYPFSDETYFFVETIDGFKQKFEFDEYFYTVDELREIEINKILDI
jgi:hypothetical protein